MGQFLSTFFSGSEAQKINLAITGLGSAWPPRVIGPEALEEYIWKTYGKDRPGLNRLVALNRKTGIQTRNICDVWDHPLFNKPTAAIAEEIDELFRHHGVDISADAANKALSDAGVTARDITHLVAVTATNAGAPGYDFLITKRLGLRDEVERALVQGVGCAGGLAALRVASDLANAASASNRPARVLVVACEICSIQVRAELELAQDSADPPVGPALFGDGAAALVLCNPAGAASPASRPVYALDDTYTSLLPGTTEHMRYRVTSLGFQLHLSKAVPACTAQAATHAFAMLQARRAASGRPRLDARACDWALHPGGLAVLRACQTALGLDMRAIRASIDVYSQRGNVSSVAVLAVLDRLRRMGPGTREVTAVSFGPGLTVEMAALRRVQGVDGPPAPDDEGEVAASKALALAALAMAGMGKGAAGSAGNGSAGNGPANGGVNGAAHKEGKTAALG